MKEDRTLKVTADIEEILARIIGPGSHKDWRMELVDTLVEYITKNEKQSN